MAIVTDPYAAAMNKYLLDQQARAAAPTVTSENTNISNMDAVSMAALQRLVADLSAQQAGSMANTQATAKQAKIGAEGYTKEAAFADSQAAMQAQIAKALESTMPQLVRASEGAGTSQSSMLALLQQQAASDAANQAATLGIKTAVDYGQIATGLLNAATQSAGTADPITAALLQALSTAKGAQTRKQSVSAQGKDPNVTSTSGVMGGGNIPVNISNGFGQTGSFGTPYASFSF